MKKYVRFGIMILVSTVIMYFLMFLNVFQLNHIYFSEMRLLMTLIMGSVMAVVMLSFMWKMYDNKKWNIIILGASFLIFGVSLWLVRSQATIDDVDYMQAMIPHHSIAILASERATIEDERVRKLADEIIAAQEREIAEMKILIEEIQQRE
ncbi:MULTISPECIES: DUF305 domain-containing protein [Trichococcus]|jgi:hypothetical protein|uniref:DUF305 domain-containing protein n=3 Tax=Trichococcus TaxID=82802 RepID=A0A143Z8W7_9LACT|nr:MULTISPECIES: DUF305 domain-containing protein [Trichococcus]CZQ87865.1 Hypothetical protein TFLO_920 [Trichococcus flocculiformis]CZR04391.1 Hypothetical protein TES5_2076 [Trichococcus sp. ES5]CZR09349.1 Hypothetical protein TR210_2707 [Trichococcus ilyis]CZR10468.1 Hypothetical protein Tcol_3024 [Trichococcus collinsii]CZR10689.1 Hypothetical protein Tcol_3075 [Trichococcus collinsii]